jgi:hypothetical protein
MTLFRRALSGICYFILSLGMLYSQDLFDYSNSLKYADYLFRTHQYGLSSMEFERVVFLEPNDTLSKLNLIKSYRYLNDFEKARQRIMDFFPDGLNNIPLDFSKEYINILLNENRIGQANDFVIDNIKLNYGSKAEYQLGILIMQNNWIAAKSFVNEHKDFLNKSERFTDLNNICDKGLNTKYKSPFLASSFSAIIPGTGKLYTGRFKDAIFSFLFISSASWLTYRSFENNRLGFNTLFFGSVTFGFYAANVYGSMKSAKSFNNEINRTFRNKAFDIILNE